MKSLNVKLPGTPENAEPTAVPVRKTGGLGTLNFYDIAKGVLVAGAAGAWIVIGQAVTIWYKGGEFSIIWEDVARSGVSGIMGYLSINLFQKARIIIKAKDL